MGQEHDDYADRDLPPPRRWPWVVISVLFGIAFFLFVIAAVLFFAAVTGPRFD